MINQIKEKELSPSYDSDEVAKAEVKDIKSSLIFMSEANLKQQRAILRSATALLSAEELDQNTLDNIEATLSSLKNQEYKYSKFEKALESINKPKAQTALTSASAIAPSLFILTEENFTTDNFLKTLEISNLLKYDDEQLANINRLAKSALQDVVNQLVSKIENIFKGDIDDIAELIRRINFITKDINISERKEGLINNLYQDAASPDQDPDQYKIIRFVSDFFRGGECKSKQDLEQLINPNLQESFVQSIRDPEVIKIITNQLSLITQQGEFLPLQGTASHGYQASNPHNKKDGEEKIRDNCITDLDELTKIFGEDFSTNFDSKTIDLIVSITAESFSHHKSKKSGGSHNFYVEVPKIFPPKESHLSSGEKEKYLDNFNIIAAHIKEISTKKTMS